MAVWLALAPFLIRADKEPEFHPGGFANVEITLVSSDARDLECALDATPWGYACKYRADGRTARAPRGGTLVPCMTATRLDLLVPDLFLQPELAERVARDDARGLPREERQRFTARCLVRVLGRVDGVRTRFLGSDPFGDRGTSWLTWPVECSVHR